MLGNEFRMAAEEIFWQVAIVLDHIKENPDEARYDMGHLWSDVYADFRDLNDFPDNDSTVRLFASLTVFVVAFCLETIDLPFYRTLAFKLSATLVLTEEQSKRIQASVVNNVASFGTERFSEAISAYMASGDDWLSEEIEAVLEEMPEASVDISKGNNQPTKPADQLTVRQLIILFEQLLNVSLDASGTNITALATLIEKVSGYKANGIRTTVNDLAKRGYDSAPVRNDIERLAVLVEKVKPDLAAQLRNITKD